MSRQASSQSEGFGSGCQANWGAPQAWSRRHHPEPPRGEGRRKLASPSISCSKAPRISPSSSWDGLPALAKRYNGARADLRPQPRSSPFVGVSSRQSPFRFRNRWLFGDRLIDLKRSLSDSDLTRPMRSARELEPQVLRAAPPVIPLLLSARAVGCASISIPPRRRIGMAR
jgi:hypothetical protein